jgi:hypothetical protein
MPFYSGCSSKISISFGGLIIYSSFEGVSEGVSNGFFEPGYSYKFMKDKFLQ